MASGGEQWEGEEVEFCPKLLLPFNALFVGASQAGKTTLLSSWLSNLDQCFEPRPHKVLWLFAESQPLLAETKKALEQQGVQMILHRGCDDVEQLVKRYAEPEKGPLVVVIDDATDTAMTKESIAGLSTRIRHQNACLFMIVHTIYSKYPSARVLAQNCAYLVLLPGARLRSQVSALSCQLRV